MNKRWGLLVLLLLCSVPACSRQAYALCLTPETPCREYERTPIIFQGLVEHVGTVEHQDLLFGQTGARVWRVKVERVWKGLKDQAEAEFLTRGVPGKMWVEDEFEFKVGERYVIWAWPSDTPPMLRTHGCSLTRLLKDAQEEVEFLDSLSRPAAGGYVYGRVWRSDHPSTADKIPAAVGVTVVLEGSGRRRETRTDDEGRFRFVGLRGGNYDVSLMLPDTLAPLRQSPADPHYPRTEMPIRASVAINSPRDCASADFRVQSSALISGFAAAEDGKPLSGIIVQGALLNHLQQQDENRAKGTFAFLFSAKAITDERGYFEFLNLPPGRYVVGVTLEHDANADQPYPRTFHPGVANIGEATVFELKPGERLDVGAFTLPPRLVPIAIHGSVVRENGEPAVDAFVAVTNNFRARLRGTRTDKNGAFSLSVFPGYSYALTASVGSGSDELVGRSTCTLQTTGAVAAPIRIELRPRGSEPKR
ncbi:MAG: carboxypeptidase regulatory-like domain-containing protein [Acidobacteria bacterium]|nr:MAG: carboxypeptidase regulatory-like domain-containing protein [Acidobacteriota bacterium]